MVKTNQKCTGILVLVSNALGEKKSLSSFLNL